jgi:hypothetical protein
MDGRRRIRTPDTIPALYRVGTARGGGSIRDLSPGGLFVLSPMLPSEGEPIAVAFRAPDGRGIAVRGIVRWNTATEGARGARRAGFGVELIDAGDDYHALVATLSDAGA